MEKIEGPYTPTTLQKEIGHPLRSEQRTGELLPRALSRVDMLVIFIAIVVFIPNSSVVLATQGAGAITYIYWIIGAVTFLGPGALVTAQLTRFLPSNGGIYVWSHRAVGPLWGFFAGFCAWFPGILVLISASGVITSIAQGIGKQLYGNQVNWLADPWQQGLIALAVMLLGGWLATLSLRLITRISRIVITLYLASIFLVGLAGIVWLLQRHAPRVSFALNVPQMSMPQFALYGVIILALLGVEVPLNMATEMRRRDAHRLFLRWGPPIVLLAYLVGTFGIMMVVPPGQAANTYSSLLAIGYVFGSPMVVAAGVSMIGFFLFVVVIYNVAFSRILFAAALDQRLPVSLARVNSHHAPHYVIRLQTIIAITLTLFTYFLGPLLYPADQDDFSSKVYNVTQASATIIWCISMVVLFLDLPILLSRFRALLKKKHEQLVAPAWLLYLCCWTGILASLLGIWTTLSFSWDSALIPNLQWSLLVGAISFLCLAIGLVSSAYPRLLSSLNAQTAVARENARLYDELHEAYTRLSKLDALKDTFLTTASHELRTPLTIVQGYLELMGDMEHLDPALRQEFINKARRACDELVLLQANIMDASRLACETATILCSSTPLQSVCLSVIDLFEAFFQGSPPTTLSRLPTEGGQKGSEVFIQQQQRQVTIDIDADMRVLADEARLKQILHNLFTNALRYSSPGTPISITAEKDAEGKMALIHVIDRGSGIPLDAQESIFERFMRLERDLNGSVRGSGLGLAISRQLVEAMHGAISVESSGIEGEGSTFTFTLPLVEPRV